MLKVENLSKEYSTPAGPLRIVSDVSLTLPPGSAVSIMGPSGSGKSTLLYMIGALEPQGYIKRTEPIPAQREGARCVSESTDRFCVSGSLPAAAVFCDRERADPDDGRRSRERRANTTRYRVAQTSRTQRASGPSSGATLGW